MRAGVEAPARRRARARRPATRPSARRRARRSRRRSTVSSAPPRAERHDRAAARLRLDGHDAEVLLAGQDHGAGARGTRRAASSSVSRPRNFDAARRPAARAARGRARRRRCAAAAPASAHASMARSIRLYGTSADTIRKWLAGAWTGGGVEEGRVDRRIHDRRLAIIVSADPPRNVARVGDEAVHARRRGRVPARQPRQHRAVEPAARQRPDPRRPEVRVELVPGVAHRRMAVADVARPARRHHRLGRAVARADRRGRSRRGRTARWRTGRAAGSGGSASRASGSRCTNDVVMRWRSIAGETEPRRWTSVKRSASG